MPSHPGKKKGKNKGSMHNDKKKGGKKKSR